MWKTLGFRKELYLKAKSCVCWDILKRGIPTGCDPHQISGNISSALAMMGYKGEVTIYAYGDRRKIPQSVQQAFNTTGITLRHIPDDISSENTAEFRMGVSSGNVGLENNFEDEKDAQRRRSVIFRDLEKLQRGNIPPGNFLLISDDSFHFALDLDYLRFKGYNTVLDYPTFGPLAERDLLLHRILGGGLTSSIVSKLGNCCCEECQVPEFSSSN